MYASRAQHQSRNDSVLHALRRLPTIASALGHQEERIPDDVSTCGDVDACSRVSRALAGAGRPPSLLVVATRLDPFHLLDYFLFIK
ncbi:uncharacterized protein K441DRAFT_667185 [Cenococcum geophilum 1.58]|uniref:uncharacterized protein n=1 Tax=Cenococcum geophilum 1.58 TaxID=794803 RepID=UPI00358EB4AE|nr:hypothetical protein K441DRAFT_667185 [Cenococcum geophilum 1.58]